MTALTPDQGPEKSDTTGPDSAVPHLQRQFIEEAKRRDESLAKIKTNDPPARKFLKWSMVLVICGMGFFGRGLKEWRLASAASSVLEEISLKDLIARGRDGNPNVLLTNFVLGDRIVYHREDGKETWKKALAPVFPLESLPHGLDRVSPDTPIQAVVASSNATNEAEFCRRCEKPKLHALVTNRSRSLSDEEIKLLKAFGEVDSSSCLIIEEGEEPNGFVTIALMIGGGVLAMVIGVRLLGRGIYRRLCNHPPAAFHQPSS